MTALTSSSYFLTQENVKQEGDTQCFQLNFKSLEGYANLLGRKVLKLATEAEYTLHACMYNPTENSFKGRIYETLPIKLVESLQRREVICPIEQVCYFHSSTQSTSLLLIVQLVASVVKAGSTTSSSLCLGWSMFPVFSSPQKLSLVVGKGIIRIPVYDGSPRVLFLLQQTIDNPHLTAVPGCMLSFSFAKHPTLSRAAHLIPEDTLVSFDDIIPGTMHTLIPEAFPKLERTQSLLIEKVVLVLFPSVDEFEEKLLEGLKKDLPTTSPFETSVLIEERRLKFFKYNGWCYTASPTIGYLDKISPSIGSISTTKSLKTRNNLILRGSVELTDLVPHPLGEIVLQLEFVIQWSGPVAYKLEQKLSPPSRTISLPLCWGVWQPFQTEQLLETDGQVSVELKAGVGFKPPSIPSSAQFSCYETNLADSGKVGFNFVPLTKSGSRIEGSQLFSPFSSPKDQGSGLFQSGIEANDSGVAIDGYPREGEEEIEVSGKPALTSTPLRRVAVEEETSLTPLPSVPHLPPMDVRVSKQFVTTLGTRRWTEPISRAVLAYFHTSDLLPTLLDSIGDPLPHVDLHDVSKDSVLSTILVRPLQVIIQLLGFESVVFGQPSSSSPLWMPDQLQLDYQLYHCPPTTLQCSLVPPSSQLQPQPPHLPHIITTLNKPAQTCINYHTLDPKPVNSFYIDGSSLMKYLRDNQLVISVYDGNSLILLGTVHVPLHLLLVDKEKFQLSLVAPIVSLDNEVEVLTTEVYENFADGRSCFTTGKLFLRLGKVLAKSQTTPLHMGQRHKPAVLNVAHPLHNATTSDETVSNEDSETKGRKFARMKAIRKQGEQQFQQGQCSSSGGDPVKHYVITSVLLESLTTPLTLYPQMGEVVYFEHHFTNWQSTAISVSVHWEDSCLKIVSNAVECQLLKRMHHLPSTAVSKSKLLDSIPKGEHHFYVQPTETVRIPFKYQSFCPPPPTRGQLIANGVRKSGHSSHRTGGYQTMVYFQDSKSKDILSVIKLTIKPQQQKIDHVFHFYHPEGTFMKKAVQVPLRKVFDETSALKSSEGVFACCSDSDTSCEIREQDDLPYVYIKCPVQLSPAVQCLYVLIYGEKFLFLPKVIWKILVHSVHRVDHSLVVGQSSFVPLTLRGDHSNRRIGCYSFFAPMMNVFTPSPQLLTAQSVTEIKLSLKSFTIGSSHLITTATDIDSGELLSCWLLLLTAHPPCITRAFQISLPVGTGEHSSKVISYTNPYHKNKKFYLTSNHPEFLSFTPVTLKLTSQAQGEVALHFSHSQQPLTISILVFINNSHDQTEECFLVKTVYS